MTCCFSSEAKENIEHFFVGQIGTRADHFLSSIDKTTENLAALFAGSVFALTSVVSLGLHSKSIRNAQEGLHQGGGVLQRLHYEVLKTLNPAADLSCFRTDDVSTEVDSMITLTCKKTLSESFLERHIVSRLCFAGIALIAVAARVFQLVVSVILTPLSLVTLGYFKEINELAQTSLGTPRLLNDIFRSVMGSINPFSLKFAG